MHPACSLAQPAKHFEIRWHNTGCVTSNGRRIKPQVQRV